MTKEELHKIGTALQPLLRFLEDTEKGGAWHDTRRQFWAHADRQIVALVDKKPDKTPDKKPAPRRAVPGKNAPNAGKH